MMKQQNAPTAELLDRTPPSDVKAERELLASLILDPSRFDDIGELPSRAFYDDAHRLIYEHITKVRKTGGLNMTTLVHSLKAAQGQDVEAYETIGGSGYIAEILNGNVTAIHAKHYANIVRELALKRDMIFHGTRTIQQAWNGRPAPEVHAELMNDLTELASRYGGTGSSEQLGRYVVGKDLLDAWLHTPPPQRLRISRTSMFDCIDTEPGNVIVIGGAPGAGKTTLITQWVFDAVIINPELSVLIINVEQEPARILVKTIARLSGLEAKSLEANKAILTRPEHQATWDTLKAIETRYAFGQGPWTWNNIAHAVDRFDPSILVVDYVQRIQSVGSDQRTRVTETMDALRAVAQQDRLVFAVSSLARGKDSRGRSTYSANEFNLASFKEAGEIEYGADQAFLVSPDADYPNMVTLKCCKRRYGPKTDVKVEFDAPSQQFCEPAAQYGFSHDAKIA